MEQTQATFNLLCDADVSWTRHYTLRSEMLTYFLNSLLDLVVYTTNVPFDSRWIQKDKWNFYFAAAASPLLCWRFVAKRAVTKALCFKAKVACEDEITNLHSELAKVRLELSKTTEESLRNHEQAKALSKVGVRRFFELDIIPASILWLFYVKLLVYGLFYCKKPSSDSYQDIGNKSVW